MIKSFYCPQCDAELKISIDRPVISDYTSIHGQDPPIEAYVFQVEIHMKCRCGTQWNTVYSFPKIR